MSVEAGFGGQSFQRSTLGKAKQARAMFGEGVVLEMDGGINAATIRECVEAGADWLVVGSAIIRTDDYGLAYRELRQLAGSSSNSQEGH
jgi:ribulose-phosphate 3-epimerase